LYEKLHKQKIVYFACFVTVPNNGTSKQYVGLFSVYQAVIQWVSNQNRNG